MGFQTSPMGQLDRHGAIIAGGSLPGRQHRPRGRSAAEETQDLKKRAAATGVAAAPVPEARSEADDRALIVRGAPTAKR